MNRERDDKAVSTFFCGLKNTFENTFSKPCLTLADRSLRHVIRFAPSDLRGDLPSFSEARHSRTTPRRTPPRFARFDVRRRARLHATRSPAARSSEAARALTRSSSSATRVPSTSESDAEKEGSGQVAREKAAGGRDGRGVEDARPERAVEDADGHRHGCARLRAGPRRSRSFLARARASSSSSSSSARIF